MAIASGEYIRATGAETVEGVAKATAFADLAAASQGDHVADPAEATAAALTDSSGGSASQTLAAITGGGAGCEDATKNAVASLADEVNKLITDVLSIRTFCDSIASRLETLDLLKSS